MQFLRKFLCSFYGIIGNIGISDFIFQPGFQWLVFNISPLLWTPWLQAAGWTSQWHPWKVDWLLGPSGILSWYRTIYLIQHYGLNIYWTNMKGLKFLDTSLEICTALLCANKNLGLAHDFAKRIFLRKHLRQTIKQLRRQFWVLFVV